MSAAQLRWETRKQCSCAYFSITRRWRCVGSGYTRECCCGAASGSLAYETTTQCAWLMQVFLGTGEALTSRVYRRQPPSPEGVSAGVHIVAHGGPVVVSSGHAYLMKSIWAPDM